MQLKYYDDYLIMSYILSRLDYCKCLLMGVPISLSNVSKKLKTLLQDSFSRQPRHHHLHPSCKCNKLHWLPMSAIAAIREHIKYKVTSMHGILVKL